MTRNVFASIVPLVIGVALPAPKTAIAGLDSRIAVARNGTSPHAAIGYPATASTPISVGVSAPAELSEALLNRIFAEAEAIWRPVGVTFDWHRIASTETPRGWQLLVTIENPRDGLAARQAPMGWISFVAGAPEQWIHLSQASAEEMIRRTPAAPDTTFEAHESMAGRALGRAFSHELGHYIFQSTGHTPHGLMRATWLSEEVLSLDRSGFGLSREEREAASRRLRQIQLTCDQPSPF